MADETEVQAETPADLTTDDDKAAEVTAETKEETPSAEVTAETKEETPEPEPEKAEDEGEEDDKPRKRSGVQRLKARNEALARELSLKEQQLEDLQRQSKAGGPEDKEPVEADFPDFFAYQRALAAHDTRKILREERIKGQTSNLQNERQALMRERAEAHMERVEAVKETITDYDKVIHSAANIELKPEVGEEILASEKSELLSYYLAKNPDKLRALNSMTGRELAKEIGRLEGSVRMPAAKTQTTAPPPVAPLKGGTAAAFDPSKASMDEYIAKRKAGWKG
jgi:hypothetical protein